MGGRCAPPILGTVLAARVPTLGRVQLARTAGAIFYRWGDYASFREALLQALPGEMALSQVASAGSFSRLAPERRRGTGLARRSRPADGGIVASISPTSGPSIASASATRPIFEPPTGRRTRSRLIQLLAIGRGPALGATGVLAALVTGPKPVVGRRGCGSAASPAPASNCRIFELQLATMIGFLDLLRRRHRHRPRRC